MLSVLFCWTVFADVVLVDVLGGTSSHVSLVEKYQNSDERIFVSIAAFLDPELTPTVANLLERAKWPEKLDFGILIQEANHTDFKWEGLANFKVKRVHYLESRGVGWARHTGKELYSGQRYLLQLDSHHRFAKDWDFMLLEDLNKCIESGSPKPIISAYAIPYYPQQPNYEQDQHPRKMVSERYYDTGKVRFAATIDPTISSWTRPHPSAVISAHLIFTFGDWLLEVPYDELIYFDGEEDTLSVRSWTHGWDIFYPHRAIVWHAYGRSDQKKHWDIHPDWWKIKAKSEDRVRKILQQHPTTEDFGVYGLGTLRSYEDYQVFSGLYFPRWHIGRRGRTGDVTVEETDPPGATVQLCSYGFDKGEFVQLKENAWEEISSEVKASFTGRKGLADGEWILHDSQRNLWVRLSPTRIYWSDFEGGPWNLLHFVKSVKCIP
eukprot:c321_g1_i1.p1 GENE.c321_g1_i1~~c321_g1_i1.p1  ORF type:complete len:435 (-),score=55.20 c321_g1_i1:22-1326(-)